MAIVRAAYLLAILFAGPASAAPTALILSPATSRIEYTVFAFGMVPMTAHFDDFGGTLETDPPPARSCRVQVSVRVASLHMADALRTRMALGSAMLDAARFPTMGFVGQCAGDTLSGTLKLHGVSHALVLSLQLQDGQVIATGTVQRRDYAILGMGGLVGQRIRIRLQTNLPQGRPGAPLLTSAKDKS